MLKLIRYLLIMAFFLNCIYIFEVKAATISAEICQNSAIHLNVNYASDHDSVALQRRNFTWTDYVRVTQLIAPSNLRIVDKALIPSAPSDLTATAFSSIQINLSWQDNSNIETGFRIERANSSDGLWTQIAEVGADITTYSITGLSASTTSYYRVRACNAVGNSICSNTASVTTPPCPDTTAPSMPTGLCATAISCSQITLSWSASTDTGDSGLKGFKVYCNGSYLTQVLAPSTTYADTGLSASSSYSYRVSAIDNAGNESALTASQSAATPECSGVTKIRTAPSAPTSLSASAVSSGKIKLTWQDNSTNEDGFEIERALSVSGPWTTICNMGANVTVYMDSGLTPLTIYVYRIRAKNMADYSPYSNTTGTRTQPNHPPEANNDSAITMINKPITIDVTINDFDVDDNLDQFSARVTSNPSHGTLVSNSNSNFTYTPKFNFTGEDSFTYRISDTEGEVDSAMVFITVSSDEPHGGNILWAKGFGDVLGDMGSSLAVDSEHNVIMVGSLGCASADFGGGKIGGKIFIVKFSSKGQYLWSKGFSMLGGEAIDVVVDSEDNIIMTGFFEEAVDFGGGTLRSTGSYPTFIVKFSKAGGHLWSIAFGSGSEMVYSVAVDSMGDVLITGGFYGTLDLGKGPLTSKNFSNDIFVGKYNGKTGKCLWAKHFGDLGPDAGYGIATDSHDNIVITGGFRNTIDFGGGQLHSTGGSIDIFVTKFTKEGMYLWSWKFGNTGSDMGNSVGVDSLDKIVVTGYCYYDNSDIFLAKLSEEGKCLWYKIFENPSSNEGNDIAVDSDDNIVITGEFLGSIDVGGGSLTTTAGNYDIFVAKYSGITGKYLCSRTFGGTGSDRGKGIAVDLLNNIVITGEFWGAVDFGTGTLTSTGNDWGDIFIIKLEP